MENLKQLVVDEATKLREHASQEERNKLILDEVDPDSPSSCIYGLMTGWCRSHRALYLLDLCGFPYSRSLNEKKKTARKDFSSNYFKHAWEVYSPIEFYIFKRAAKIKPIVEFIKGERETLTVDDL